MYIPQYLDKFMFEKPRQNKDQNASPWVHGHDHLRTWWGNKNMTPLILHPKKGTNHVDWNKAKH